MVLIRVRPFLFARTMMTFHKILRITERPHRADKSAIIGINLRTSPSTSVGARAMGSGGEGLHDSVAQIGLDKWTRREPGEKPGGEGEHAQPRGDGTSHCKHN